MSFLSILKSTGEDLLKGAVISQPIVTTFNPIAGAMLGVIIQGVTAAEQMIPGEKQGAQKKNLVIGQVQAALPFVELGYSLAGGTPPAEADSLSQASTAIDSVVAAANALAKWLPPLPATTKA